MFDLILLEPEQEELLMTLVEAARNTPREDRQEFMFIQVMGGAYLQHPGLKGKSLHVYRGDIEVLGSVGLLNLNHSSRGNMHFDVSPLGSRYYEYLKQRLGEPVTRIEVSVQNYLNSQDFQQKYPSAYLRWSDAEKLLWSADSDQKLTTIGHLCREAMQEFAAALIDRYQLSNTSDNKASTVARMRAVLNTQTEKLGSTVKPFMDALLAYWGATIDLIQRQEHGAQKEGNSLVWKDGRLVVFNTAMVMFEIDQVLS